MKAVAALLLMVSTAMADEPVDTPPPPAPAPVEAPRPTAPPTAPATSPDAIPYTPPPSRDIVISAPGERTTKNWLTLGAIAGAGLLVGGVGLYYNLDARDASNQVTAQTAIDPLSGSHGSGRTWSAADQALVDRANSSSTKMEVFYAIGGADVTAAIVMYFVTEPPEQRSVIHTHVGVSPNGAMIFGSF